MYSISLQASAMLSQSGCCVTRVGRSTRRHGCRIRGEEVIARVLGHEGLVLSRREIASSGRVYSRRFDTFTASINLGSIRPLRTFLDPWVR